MSIKPLETTFNQSVAIKFSMYNGLFQSLPFNQIHRVGTLLSILTELTKEGHSKKWTPIEIMQQFFDKHTEITSVEEQHNLLFNFIQYIERQVVLFDSIEEAAFDDLEPFQKGLNLRGLLQLSKKQNQLENIREKLRDFKIRVVFTAHPTQFYPHTVLGIIYNLRTAVKKNDIEQINLLIQQLAQTPFINQNPPTPLEEAQSIIWYLRNVYYEAVGKLNNEVKEYFLEDESQPSVIDLGFWPGGDRDGNPFVTAQVSLEVAHELRHAILKCYYRDIKRLRRKLTFKGIYESLSVLKEQLYRNMFSLDCDIDLEQCIKTLQNIRIELLSDHNSIFLDEIDIVISKMKCFGLHFASLDIRQDSRIHTQVISNIINYLQVSKTPYEQLSKEEKIAILTTISANVSAEDFNETIIKDTIETVKVLRKIQQLNGERGVNRYIISNSEDELAVLQTLALFKVCGYKDSDIHFDIVPLFETMKGMENSEATMQYLYQQPYYSTHLRNRNKQQTIMLGFSDGTKDGGYLKANWEIFLTKESLTKVSEQNGVRVLFFDGRGGPPARGGGKTHRFYAAQGDTVANNEIQLTIQGQTITSMYGTVEGAKNNFEQLFTAGLINHILPEKEHNEPDTRQLLEKMAQYSYESYLALKNHPLFVPYLEQMSTLKYYGLTKIGSRPSKRNKDAALVFEDLRAIPFVGAWSLLKQNIPGFYGFGSALQRLLDEGYETELMNLYKTSRFFRTLAMNSMMALTKSMFSLTNYMSEDECFGEFWTLLFEEYERTISILLQISGYQELMEEEMLDRLSVKMREQMVLPLLSIQQYALQRLQTESDEATALVLEKIVIRSLFGNINASRNSA